MSADPNSSKRPVPLEVLSLLDATERYLQVCEGVTPAVARLGADGSFLLELLGGARSSLEWGTPGSIRMAARELIDADA